MLVIENAHAAPTGATINGKQYECIRWHSLGGLFKKVGAEFYLSARATNMPGVFGMHGLRNATWHGYARLGADGALVTADDLR